MASLTVKNIPDRLLGRLKQNAKRHRRSINSEVIVYLERALAQPTVDPEVFLERARTLREGLPRLFVRTAELTRAKRWGRP